MSWLYLPEAAEDYLEAGYLDGARYAMWSGTATRQIFYRPASVTAISKRLQFGTMRVRSMGARGLGRWISSLADSPASRSARRGEDSPSEIRAICGRRQSESFAWYDRDGACWRTYQASLANPIGEPFSQTWPKQGSLRSGVVYQRRPLAPATNGNGCGLWPTPKVSRGGYTYSKGDHSKPTPTLEDAVKIWPTPTVGDATGGRTTSKGKDHPTSLNMAARLWPTPRSTDGTNGGLVTPRKSRNGGNLIEAVSMEMFPSPKARDWRTGDRPENREARHWRTPDLNDVAAPGGQLNPDWVEWLMGWPVGWTSLEPLPRESMEAWDLGDWWSEEPPDLPRVVRGAKMRRERLTAIGNGQVPAVFAAGWRILSGRLIE